MVDINIDSKQLERIANMREAVKRREELEYNDRLTAAAPKMLAILEDIIDAANAWENGPVDHGISEWKDDILDTLAEIRGINNQGAVTGRFKASLPNYSHAPRGGIHE